jgi:hypothetical protein
MPVTYEASPGVLILRLVGNHTLAEESETLARALVSPALEIRAALLVDARRSTANPQGPSIAERARCLARLHGCLLPRCAVVVSDSLHYGLARMLAAHAESHGIAVDVFADETNAMAWLAWDDASDHDTTDACYVIASYAEELDGTGTERRGPSGRVTPSLPRRR